MACREFLSAEVKKKRERKRHIAVIKQPSMCKIHTLLPSTACVLADGFIHTYFSHYSSLGGKAFQGPLNCSIL